MANIPEVKLGLVAVSRDCFVLSFSLNRLKNVANACTKLGINIYEAKTGVENETTMLKAVDEIKKAGCNALVVFLGNFGPETPETLLAQYFDGPAMFVGHTEDNINSLVEDRGDAFCGILNCSYNLGLRKIPSHIPAYPIGLPDEIAGMIGDFVPVARALIGLSSLKVITFGPRPQDFFACNAPIKGLYDLGVEIEENSELDLHVAFRNHEKDKRIPDVAREMAEELGGDSNPYPDLLPKLAQFELALLDWAEAHRGAKKYVVFANKCWPAFPSEFGFMPCYVNSRFAARGMPISCEVDIYGGLSEYIGACVTNGAVTLLDLDCSIPKDLWEQEVKGRYPYELNDLFMGFHCGNTPLCMLRKEKNTAMKFQFLQNRLLEKGATPDISRGTLEGDINAGDITFFRLHSNADTSLQAYVAQGEVLPAATHSFGGAGVIGISELARFYRNVLIEKHFPHHGAMVFGKYGGALWSVFQYLGIKDISFNQPKGMLYPAENPFGK
jgi:L-fucose isomerase-like protein